MKKRHILLAIFISVSVFLFLLFLIYLIYCYAYYDKKQEGIYINNYNDKLYDFVFDNMYLSDKIDRNNYYYVLNLMTNKNTLTEIYEHYYKDNYNLDDFINKYYFTYSVGLEDVTFETSGKTTIKDRRNIKYNNIVLTSDSGNKVNFGVKENVGFRIEEGASLKVDGKECQIAENVCHFNYIIGGLHILEYVSNNLKYYGIVNVLDGDVVIEVTVLDSLIPIGNVKGKIKENEAEAINPRFGTYKLRECYMAFSCPDYKRSYIILNDDGTVEMYIWINLDQAGDTYYGKYEISNNHIKFKFNKHTYTVFDYDTKQTSTVENNSYTEFKFKIGDQYTLINDNYKFTFYE